MKGVSIKKLAALGIGSLMALSLGFAGAVSYQGTQLVNDGGVPVAKVVVGEKAQAIDGVAAAKIASFLASKAYKSTVLNAKVTGQATCTASGSAGGVGACPVTSKSVTLEVQLPGQSGGTYKFTTLIDDFADRTPENRNRTKGGTDKYDTSPSEQGSNNRYDFPFYSFSTSTAEPSSTVASVVPSGVNEAMVRVTGNDLTSLKSTTVVDEKAAKKWEQRQYLWFAGYNKFTDIDDNNKLKFTPEFAAYSTKFFGVDGVSQDGGIPQSTNDAADDGYLVLGSGERVGNSYYIGNHRVRIKFLGDDWVITDMEPSTDSGYANLTADGEFVTGGRVTLAKESKYGILNVGGAPLEAEGIKVRLGDIALATTQNNVHNAILDILDSSDQVIQQTQVAPGSSTEVLTPTGSKVKIRVYQTAPGFTLTQKWAELAIIKDELVLRHGQSLDGTDNKDYKIYLKWVNNLRPSSSSDGSDAAKADALREIAVYRNTFTETSYSEGWVLPVVVKPANFNFKYVGLDLDKSKDYDDLTFKVEKKRFKAGVTGSLSTAAVSSCAYTEEYTDVDVLTIRSASGALQPYSYTGNGANDLSSNTFDTLYLVLSNSSSIAHSTQHGDLIFPLQNTLTCTSGGDVSYGAYVANYSEAGTTKSNSLYRIYYDVAGTQKSTDKGGVVTLTLTNSTPNDLSKVAVKVYEDTGTWDSETNVPGYFHFYVNASATDPKLYQADDLSDKLDNNMNYYYTYYLSGNSFESGATSRLMKVNQYTQRGSYITYSSESEARLKIAKTVGRLQFEISAAGAAAGATNDETLSEGDEREWAGVKVKVKKIDCQTGACTVGATGAPACTVDSTGVKAVLVDADGVEYGTSYETAIPTPLAGDLVVLDSSAPTGKLIAVGGPAVNTVAKNALGDSVDFTKQNVVVKQQGDVIVVAGLTGADTMTATTQFLSQLKTE